MKRGVGWSGALALALAVSGCSKDENPPPPPPQGDGTVKSVATAVNGGTTFRLPFDAALSPDGKTAYFTALVDEGAALFKVPTAGGMVTLLADLVSPGSLDVTSDGQTVVVADPGVESGAGALGAMLTVSASGGSPSVLTGTVGTLPGAWPSPVVASSSPGPIPPTAPRACSRPPPAAVSPPSSSPESSSRREWRLVRPARCTSSTPRAMAPARSTSSRIVSGTATELVKGLRVGFPAGLAVAQNGANFLVASTDPATGKARLERFAVSGMRAGNPFTDTVGSFDNPAGLHRASRSDTYAYVDSEASGAGTVFVVNPQ